MPILKRGEVYYNINSKKNNYIESIIPVNDIVVSDKLFKCFKKKDNHETRSEQFTMRKSS
jgi:hypothetical protein